VSKHIDWSTKYEMGIEEIDLQHHYFLDLINRLAGELTVAEDPHYRQALFKELGAYAHFHFISEENIVYRAGYAALNEHKGHHDLLVDRLNVHKLEFEEGRIRAEEIIDFLLLWFIKHTLGEDKKFADFLKRG